MKLEFSGQISWESDQWEPSCSMRMDNQTDRWTDTIKLTVTVLTSYLIINKTPLFQESMNSHDSTNISSQVAPARSTGDVLCRVETVCINHEVAIRQVDLWCLWFVLPIEELWQGTFLYCVDRIVVKPCRVAWDDDVMRLLRHIILLPIVLCIEFLYIQ